MGRLRDLKKSGKKPTEYEGLTEQDILNTLTPPEEGKYERLDDLEVVADDRRRGRQAVSINGVMGRIVLYAGSYDAMCAGGQAEGGVRPTQDESEIPEDVLDMSVFSERDRGTPYPHDRQNDVVKRKVIN